MIGINPEMWTVPSDTAKPNNSIVAIGGDGIGVEVMQAAVKCIAAVSPSTQITTWLCDWPAESEKSSLPDKMVEEINGSGAVLFGAADVNGRALGALRYLRWSEHGAFINVRPTTSLPGLTRMTGDKATNLVIVRELSEGMYPGAEGELAEFLQRWPDFKDRLGRPIPKDGIFAMHIVTEAASRRVARYAGELAHHRKSREWSPGKVTIVGKTNVLRRSEGLFFKICQEELAKFPEVSVDYLHVDEAARRLVVEPHKFDVLLTTNLFGDILSDVACEAMGGLAMAPSAGIGPKFSYFEPVHGSAPDIAGKNLANPSATLLSAAMALRHIGQNKAGNILAQATLAAAREAPTKDLGGSSTCEQFANETSKRIKAALAA